MSTISPSNGAAPAKLHAQPGRFVEASLLRSFFARAFLKSRSAASAVWNSARVFNSFSFVEPLYVGHQFGMRWRRVRLFWSRASMAACTTFNFYRR